MSGGTELSRVELEQLLRELGLELDSQGITAQLFVVGGAAMALAFNSRRTTRDVDGAFEPKSVVYDAAKTIARRHGLPDDWLNDGVKGMLPGPDPEARVFLDTPGISVSVPSARYLLALKVASARVDRDTDDIRVLAKHCGVSTAEGILQVAADVIGESRLSPKSQFVVMEMFSERRPLRQRFADWRQARAEANQARAKRPTKPTPSSPQQGRTLPGRCPGRTKAGKPCVLRGGHGGYHRGS